MTNGPDARPIYLETNFFIRAVEGAPEAATPARRLLDALRARNKAAVTSEITFAEVLAPPSRPDALPLQLKRRAYLDLLLWSRFIELMPVSRNILIETADLRIAKKMKLPDAIHLVTAIQSNCRYVVSGDRDFNRLPNDMERINPDEQGIGKLLGLILHD